jgi:hypothetical protein
MLFGNFDITLSNFRSRPHVTFYLILILSAVLSVNLATDYNQDVALKQNSAFDHLYEKVNSPIHKFVDLAYSKLLTSSAIQISLVSSVSSH